PPTSPLFPYTTLFRSRGAADGLQRRLALRPRTLDRAGEDLGRLRTRDAVLAVDHEEGHAGRAVGTGLVDVGVDLGVVLVAGQHRSEEHTSELQSRENL